VIREGEGIDDIELVFFQLESKSGTESSAEHFLWKVVLIISRLRAEDRTALPPQRIPDFADTGATGSFLPPGLLSTSGNVLAGFRLVRAGALACEVLLHGVVEQTFVHRSAEYFV